VGRSSIAILVAAMLVAGCATKPKPAPQASAEPPAESSLPSPDPDTAAPDLQAQFADQAGDRIYFAFDSFDLNPESDATLQQQAIWLRQHPETRVLLAGNCDERGTRDYNLALGARRAAAAKDRLVALGVEARRLDTISYGKDRPIDPGSSEEAWARNRNTHSLLIKLSEASSN
jgi:peptidoglycan-associated lipoprotein